NHHLEFWKPRGQCLRALWTGLRQQYLQTLKVSSVLSFKVVKLLLHGINWIFNTRLACQTGAIVLPTKIQDSDLRSEIGIDHPKHSSTIVNHNIRIGIRIVCGFHRYVMGEIEERRVD